MLSIAHAPTYETMDDVRTLMKGEASGLHGLRVLIVEDSYVVARAVQSLLEEIGMVVVGPVATSTAAERLLVEGCPEVAIVDIHLMGEKSFHLIDRLHAAGIPVLAMSGLAARASTARAAAVLQKPFSGSELLAALYGVLASSLPSGAS